MESQGSGEMHPASRRSVGRRNPAGSTRRRRGIARRTDSCERTSAPEHPAAAPRHDGTTSLTAATRTLPVPPDPPAEAPLSHTGCSGRHGSVCGSGGRRSEPLSMPWLTMSPPNPYDPSNTTCRPERSLRMPANRWSSLAPQPSTCGRSFNGPVISTSACAVQAKLASPHRMSKVERPTACRQRHAVGGAGMQITRRPAGLEKRP